MKGLAIWKKDLMSSLLLKKVAMIDVDFINHFY